MPRRDARYLYICEDGLVHYCSQQRGYPAVPLENYTREDIRREFYAEKPCAKMCTIACVQQVAMMDNWRALSARLIPLQKMSVNSPSKKLSGRFQKSSILLPFCLF